MGRKLGLGLVVFTLVALSLALPTVVRAEITILGAGSYHNVTYTMEIGDTINWNWEVIGSGVVDFWIEDDDGTRYRFQQDARESIGSFVVPNHGQWTVTLYNRGSHSVTLDVSVNDVYIGDVENLFTMLMWLFIIMGVIIVVAIIVIIVLVFKKKEPEQPQHPQRPPQ